MMVLRVAIVVSYILLGVAAWEKREACGKRPRAGPCNASIPRWYFDHQRKKCAKFIWGGCRGSVPFETRQECEEADCGAGSPPRPSPIPLLARCKLWSGRGIGRGQFKRWFFDPHTQECASFSWGGYGGVVPFETKKDCLLANCAQNRCGVAPRTGPCKALIRGYYFDPKKKKCRSFLWGGCLGVLPFATLRQCEDACPIIQEPCLEKPDPGACSEAKVRFYFNAETKECASFLWGGCGGTVPFESKSDCEAAKCRCKLRASSGPCNESITRWYYDEAFHSCYSFRYGGCEGTVPFNTELECSQEDCSSLDTGSFHFHPMYQNKY